LNNYQYVLNPMGWVDPLGLASVPGDCVCGGSSAQSAKDRVLANIAESQSARNASNFEIHLAQSDQIRWGYLPDEWNLTSLKAGDQLVGGLPGQSSYYTTFRTLDASSGSRSTLFKSLQVTPHKEFGFRPQVGIYEVQENLSKIPTGIVKANTDLGPGGGDQFWIRDYSTVLKLVKVMDLGM